MKHYLDTEFNTWGGAIISLALVPEDGSKELYLIKKGVPGTIHEWVEANVLPVMFEGDTKDIALITSEKFGHPIREYFIRKADIAPVVICDWPDDIKYMCDELIVGAGQRVAIPRITFELTELSAWDCTEDQVLPGAVQHNALWDARMLRRADSQPSPDVEGTD